MFLESLLSVMRELGGIIEDNIVSIQKQGWARQV